MNFFSWVGVILVILLIIAAITSPSDQKFTDFINNDKGGDTMSCKPIMGKNDRNQTIRKNCISKICQLLRNRGTPSTEK